MTHFAHIINPVDAEIGSDFYQCQQVSFDSILAAKAFTKKATIQLGITQFELDKVVVPPAFQKLSNLTQSILDLNTSYSGKKLPLIAEIFSKFKEIPEADFYIYTNADIALMPYFYDSIFEHLSKGADAIVINRRRISKTYLRQPSINQMYSDLGRSHPGFDCFVFSKELLADFVLGNICVGIPFLEVTIIHNLVSFAKNPLFILDAHLTFHLGMEVMPARNKVFYRQNRKEFFNHIYPKLKPYFRLSKFPYAALPWPQRALKWMLNPSLFTVNYLKLEGEHFLNELRWRFLQR